MEGSSALVVKVNVARPVCGLRFVGVCGQSGVLWFFPAQYKQRFSFLRRCFSSSERGPRGFDLGFLLLEFELSLAVVEELGAEDEEAEGLFCGGEL